VTPDRHTSDVQTQETIMLLLSLFPGIDLLGMGFELEGFCVVRGPDLIFGGDIRDFHPPPGRFDGVIAGSPCQDFSRLRRGAPTGAGRAMLGEFARCVEEAQPDWFLLENVPGVPDIAISGYVVQRFDLRANECGLSQQRLRHFQFGSCRGTVLVLERDARRPITAPACTASETSRAGRRGWAEFCAAMGLPSGFELPAFKLSARYAAVGNGVPLPVAQFVARAVRDCQYPASRVRLCICGCGRRVTGKQLAATPACRKREQRKRDAARNGEPRRVTAPVTRRPPTHRGSSPPSSTR
jgi:DNA (cytosine-5)-methyltransferase 1